MILDIPKELAHFVCGHESSALAVKRCGQDVSVMVMKTREPATYFLSNMASVESKPEHLLHSVKNMSLLARARRWASARACPTAVLGKEVLSAQPSLTDRHDVQIRPAMHRSIQMNTEKSFKNKCVLPLGVHVTARSPEGHNQSPGKPRS